MIFEMRLFLFFFLLCRKIPAGSPASWLVVRAMTSCCVSRFSNECARALHVYGHHLLHRMCAVLYRSHENHTNQRFAPRDWIRGLVQRHIIDFRRPFAVGSRNCIPTSRPGQTQTPSLILASPRRQSLSDLDQLCHILWSLFIQ